MLLKKSNPAHRLFGSKEPEPKAPKHRAEDGFVVTIAYTLLDESGKILDTTDGKGVLAYIHGSDQLPMAFQEQLQGRQSDEKIKHQFSAEEVYGARNEKNTAELESPLFEGVDQVTRGMRFQTMTDEGLRCVTVTDVDENLITVDLNHPLAGIPIIFNATVVSVRPAAKEELASGKVL